MGESMTPQEFKDWREALGLTQEQAGQALGVTRRAVVKWEAGDAPISQAVQLACAYLSGQPPGTSDRARGGANGSIAKEDRALLGALAKEERSVLVPANLIRDACNALEHLDGTGPTIASDIYAAIESNLLPAIQFGAAKERAR